MLDLVEKYITIGGEAPLSGLPIYLIRFSGCNLSCSYCDTPYRNEVNDNFTVEELSDEIVSHINQYPELRILFTGGEPLLGERQGELIHLIKKLNNIDFYIETNGSIKITDFSLSNCYYIVDWKSPSSGFEDQFELGNLKKLRMDMDCIKFVVGPNDLEWLKDTIKTVLSRNPFIPLYVSPQWNVLPPVILTEFILRNKLPLRLSLQLHKIIWPPHQRGV